MWHRLVQKRQYVLLLSLKVERKNVEECLIEQEKVRNLLVADDRGVVVARVQGSDVGVICMCHL